LIYYIFLEKISLNNIKEKTTHENHHEGRVQFGGER
jgi:hypothetical protein